MIRQAIALPGNRQREHSISSCQLPLINIDVLRAADPIVSCKVAEGQFLG